MIQLKITAALACFFLFSTINAQSVLGTWIATDGETDKPQSHVEIYEKNGKLFGRIVKLLTNSATEICNNCPDGRAGKRVLDIDIIEGLKPYKNYYSYGHIINPTTGKKYKCSIWREGENLILRGYLGVEALGKSSVWKPLK